MLAEILPVARLPRQISTFSYLVPPELIGQVKVGQIVNINLRGSKTIGLITGLNKNNNLKSHFKLKNILGLVSNMSLLTETHLKLINYIADEYYHSPAMVLNSLLPNIGKNKKNITPEKILIDKKKKYSKNTTILMWSDNYNNQIKNYFEITKKILSQNNQILIIVPEIEDIKKILSENKQKIEIVQVHSRINKKETWNNWQTIISGKPCLIIGTKIVVLQPFINLGAIIVHQEQNWNLKQSDINPRFDSRTVAAYLAELLDIPLYLATSAPRLETFFQGENKQLDFKVNFNNKKNIFEFINLENERRSGNYSLLSQKLIEDINLNVTKNKKTFIFLNKRGLAHTVSCSECHYTFKCPRCRLSMTFHLEKNELICHHCTHVQELPPLCPGCHGTNIKFSSAGTERIENELKKILPALTISRLDKDSPEDKNKNSQVIIGTEYALKKIDWHNIKLTAVLSLEQMLNRPDFRANEKAWQIILEINSLMTDGKILIQTNSPENTICQSLVNNDFSKFYQQELLVRKTFFYPPYSRIIKLIYQNKQEKKVFNEAQLLYKKISNIFDKNVKIMSPQPTYPKKIRNNFRYQIVLKTEFAIKLPLKKIIPPDWIIDVDPEHII